MQGRQCSGCAAYHSDGEIAAHFKASASRDVVEALARETGFKRRVFITQNAWTKCVQVPEGVVCQDERGRLHDVLWMLRCAIKAMPQDDDLSWFSVKVRVGNAERAFKTVKLLSQCGAVDIDDPAPALTIMLPEDY